MLYMGTEIPFQTIDFSSLTITEDGEEIMKVEDNSKYEFDSEELDDFMHRLHGQ